MKNDQLQKHHQQLTTSCIWSHFGAMHVFPVGRTQHDASHVSFGAAEPSKGAYDESFVSFYQRHPKLPGSFLRARFDQDYLLEFPADECVQIFHVDGTPVFRRHKLNNRRMVAVMMKYVSFSLSRGTSKMREQAHSLACPIVWTSQSGYWTKWVEQRSWSPFITVASTTRIIIL